jgi:hypothetical protein
MPSLAGNDFPTGKLRRLFSGVLMFTFVLNDLENKNIKMQNTRVRIIFRNNNRSPKALCL